MSDIKGGVIFEYHPISDPRKLGDVLQKLYK